MRSKSYKAEGQFDMPAAGVCQRRLTGAPDASFQPS